jgi:polar amino acid transport system substrate-binding protein
MPRTQRVRFLYAVIPLVSATLAGNTRAEEIVLSTGEWPPYTSRNLPGYGNIARLVSDAFATQGIKVTYAFRPWALAFKEAKENKVAGSVVWGHGMPDSDRQRHFLYSEPVFRTRSVFFYRAGSSFNWQTFRDLNRWRIGGTEAYEYQFERELVQRLRPVPTDLACLQKLLTHEVDVCPLEYDVGIYLLRLRFSVEQARTITVHPRPYAFTSYHVIFPRTSRDGSSYLAKFNQGLAKLQQDGNYQKYMQGLKLGNY